MRSFGYLSLFWEILYRHDLQECDIWIEGEIAKLSKGAAVDAVLFLSQMLAVWKDHCSQMLIIRSIFLYLDRTYVISSSAVRSLFDMGLDSFRTHLQSHPEARLTSAIPFMCIIDSNRVYLLPTITSP